MSTLELEWLRNNRSGGFAPESGAAAFRDLLIFEERLKQNAARLHKRKHKYQLFLLILCLVVMWLAYAVTSAQKRTIMQIIRIGLLWICGVMLFLFFASGIYADKITAANKFVPQANRSLQSFNMFLNMRTVSRPAWYERWWSSSQEIQPERRILFGHYGRRTRIFTGNTSVPPTKNERGEIVFSSRVNSEFREGYERYRNAFERKRREKLESKRRVASRWSWLLSLVQKKRAAPAAAHVKTE